MDTLIKSILQIEADAQKLVAQSKARQACFDTDCAEKRAALEAEIGGRCERRIAKMQEAEASYRDGEIAKIRAQAEQRQAELEARYRENRDAWVRRLTDTILGGE